MKLLLCCITVHLCLGNRPPYPPLRQRVVSFHLDNRASMADSGSVVSHVSKVKCTLMCFENPSCISVFYWKSEGKCRTNAAPQIPAEHPRQGNVNSQDPKSKVNRQDSKRKVNEQDPKSKVNGHYPKSKVNGLDPKSKVNGHDPKSKVNGKDPKSKVNGQEPKSKANGQDPKSKVNDQDPKSKVNGQDPKSKVNGKDPKSKVNGKDQKSKVNGQDPKSKVNGQYPKSKMYYAVLRNVLIGPCANHTSPSGSPPCLGDYEERVPNAICSSESCTRSCTCHDNYRDVLLDVVSVNNTCITNGSWTPPSINCSGPYIRLTTPSISYYTFQQISANNLHTITGGTSTVVFLVKTCQDANFALHTSPNTYTTAMFEVVIGGWGNTRCVIRGCMSCESEADYHESSIVSCIKYRPFWLSWKNGVISAGKGPVAGAQKFMQWSPTQAIVINHVSISTYVNNSGTWLFLQQ